MNAMRRIGDGELPFRDRRHAGAVLAGRLAHYRGRPSLLVLALPRGGVPVAFEVAGSLQAPLDVFVVRKLGYPGHEEYAMGAIASGGVRVMNRLDGLPVSEAEIERVAAREQEELLRRERLYRGDAPPADLAGRTVIVVDDGLATGATMRAAATAIRQQRPARLCVAVPVGARDSCEAMRDVCDEVVCAATPEPFTAVGLWYRDFPQTSDDEVRELLQRARATH
ncbi:MAG TPA: phosphoribosyltransferase [Ramlibacter sp.]|nr:phosphoribosyltransferase [Ramlibacter sp.]